MAVRDAAESEQNQGGNLSPGSLSLETIVQAVAQPQLALVPRKPNCFVWYEGDPCDELIQQYNQAAEQHQQQEWQVSIAAPLQKQIVDQQRQIADQQNQIKTLQLQIESQTTAALQSEGRNRAALDVIGAGLGVGLAFIVAFASFRRFARNSTFRSLHRNPTRLHETRSHLAG